MLVRLSNREDPDQTASSESLGGISLSTTIHMKDTLNLTYPDQPVGNIKHTAASRTHVDL